MALTDTAIKAAKLPAAKKQLITQSIDPSLKPASLPRMLLSGIHFNHGFLIKPSEMTIL